MSSISPASHIQSFHFRYATATMCYSRAFLCRSDFLFNCPPYEVFRVDPETECTPDNVHTE